MKKSTIAILAIAVIIIGGLVYWGTKDNSLENITEDYQASNQADLIYYYGQECPACKQVNKFLEENNISEKVDFAKKEVWYNQENNQELVQKANECGLAESEIGVPFVYSDGNCYIGVKEVEDIFKQKAGM